MDPTHRSDRRLTPSTDAALESGAGASGNETRIREVERKSVLTDHPILNNPEAARMCGAIARLQAANYMEALERHEKHVSRRGTVLGTIQNLFDEAGKYQPQLLQTAYAPDAKLGPCLKDIFPDAPPSSVLKSSWRLLDVLYKTGLVQPVRTLAPQSMGGGIVGVRIVSQELFDAMK